MQHTAQVAAIKLLFDFLDNGTTQLAEDVYRQPVSDFLSDDMAARERDVLFRGPPLLICLSCELIEPGDYVCDDFSGVPIIVVRTNSGSVAAYRNACRHRGARLVCDRGQGLSRFHCPYHAWSYSTATGELVSIPFESGFTGVDKTSQGLVRLPVVEHDGMVFVSPLPESTVDLPGYLDTFTEDLSAYGLRDYHHFETRVLEPAINWKLVVDTFLETYHLSTLHRTTIAPLLHSNLNTFTAMGPHLRMVAVRKTFGELRELPESSWDLLPHSAIVYVLFPNTVFIMQGDHLETWRVYPGDTPDSSRMHVSLYTPEPTETDSARRHWTNNMDLLMATVLEEDFPLATNMQRDFPEGNEYLLFGRNEPALQHFHKSLAEVL